MLTTVNRVSKNKATLTGLDRDRKYITFDGVDGYATAGDSLKLGTGPFTLNAWVKRGHSQNSIVYNLATINLSTNYQYLYSNVFHMITVTSDRAGNNEIYLNGIPLLDGGICNASNFDCGSNPVTFAKKLGAYNAVNISEFSAYDIALSSTDVKRMFNGGKSFNHLKWEYKGNCHSWYGFGDNEDTHSAIQNLCADEPGLFDGKGTGLGTFNTTVNEVLDK